MLLVFVLVAFVFGQQVTPVIRVFRQATCSITDGFVMQFNLQVVDKASCATSPCSQTVPNLSTDQVCEPSTNVTSPWPLVWQLYAGRNCESGTQVKEEERESNGKKKFKSLHR